ncbi:hypothetical protein [Mucilaginibacter antarcticus]|uniref:hypothetical protein n=1 Tax=Mucilaginibacter antarcticus TaxID=1855725 RepID=UPI00363E6DE5
MDKPYYALGDTIWFKGYVTIGSRHQLSALSGAVYVDLINERDSIVKALKLPVTAGMVMGDFVLIDDYKQEATASEPTLNGCAMPAPSISLTILLP